MSMEDLQEQHEKLVAKCERENALYDKIYPDGFFRILSRFGKHVAYGFSCRKCKLTVQSLGLTELQPIRHCNTVSVLKLRTGFFADLRNRLRLPAYRVGANKLFWI